MKNNNVIMAAVVGVILLAVVGGYFVMSQKSTKPANTNEAAEEEVVATLKPEDVGLEFTLRPDKKAVKVSLSKIDDIQMAEYEIQYKYEDDGVEKDEAFIGEITIEEGADTAETNYRDLGTCSSGVCKYQKVTSDIKLLLKVTKKDGKVYSVEDTIKY